MSCVCSGMVVAVSSCYAKGRRVRTDGSVVYFLTIHSLHHVLLSHCLLFLCFPSNYFTEM
jgi:hypothetical protein